MPSQLNSLANQIFAEQPARPPGHSLDTFGHYYIESHAFTSFRAGWMEMTKPRRCGDYNLSAQIAGSMELGPYERQMLEEILLFPSDLAIITGIAGSGKTSSLRFILDHYERNARTSNPDVVKHVYIDLNPLTGTVRRKDDEKYGAGLEFLLEKAPNKIPDAILKSLKKEAERKRTKPMALLLELAATAYRWAASEEDAPGPFELGPEILAVGELPHYANPDEGYRHLLSMLSQHSQEDRLAYWFGLLDCLCLRFGHTSPPLLVVVDNVDPLPEYAQQSLLGILLDVSQKSSFKIVMPVRLSTFRSPAFAREVNWYPHCGPSPLDVVVSRLLRFVRRPEEFSAYNTIGDAQWRDRAVLRAFDLLLRLTHGRRGEQLAGRLILAGASHSIRRALAAARHLFESSELTYSYSEPARTIASVSRLVDSIKIAGCVARIGMAIREEIITAAVDAGADSQVLDAQTLAVRIARAMSETFSRGLLRSSGPDCWCNSRVWESADVLQNFQQDVRDGIAFARSRASRDEFDALILKSAFREAVTEWRSSMNFDDDQAYCVNKLASSVEEAIARDEVYADVDDDTMDVRLAWDDDGACSRVLDANPRHVVVQALATSGHFANIFIESGPHGGELSAIPLMFLYAIGGQKDGRMPIGSFIERFEAKNLSKDRILRVVNELSSAGQRLLWISKEFQCQSWDDLVAQREIRIAPGGWGYLCSALEEVDYVLGMLSHGHEWLGGRCAAAVDALGRLHRKLMAQIPSHLPAAERTHHVQDAAIVLDITSRCTWGLARALRGHFAAVKGSVGNRIGPERRKVELSRARQAAVSWLKLIEGSESELKAALGESVTCPALESLGRLLTSSAMPSVSASSDSAKLVLRSLLAGDRLMAPGLAPDEYHGVQIDEVVLTPHQPHVVDGGLPSAGGFSV